MTNENLQNQIIDDLKNDFPEMIIEKDDDSIIIKGNDNTLWDIFDILYGRLDNVEFNLDKDEGNSIIIRV